jgi:hypothetical protein
MLNLALMPVAGLFALAALGIIPLYALFLASGYALRRLSLKTVRVPAPVLLMDEAPQQPAVAALLVLMMVCAGVHFAPFA